MAAVRTVSTNRRARFDYEVLDTVEAGVVLTGTEIKSIREGRANLAHAYARPEDGEMWLLGAHIAEYSHSGVGGSHDPARPRKLLLHREQIRRMTRQVAERGLTIVPLETLLEAAPGQGRAWTRQGPETVRQAEGHQGQGAREGGPRSDQALMGRAIGRTCV